MKVFKGKIWAAIGSIMDHAAAAASTTTTTNKSSSVPDRALLAGIEAAVERCFTGDVVDDRHVREILFLVSNAPGAITFLSRRITARLEAARAPAAALRALLLVHRLLRAGDRYFEQDLRGLWASRDLRVDAPRCSCSAASADDYVCARAAAATGVCAFVHGYAAYLEERMQWVINQAGNLEPARRRHDDSSGSGGNLPPRYSSSSSSSSGHEEALLFKLAMCQRLLDLAIQLLPDNNASASAAARSAFGIVLRESFKVYAAFTEGLDAMLMRSTSLAGLSKPLRAAAREVLRKASSQTPELKEFYHKCKRSSSASKGLEYPLVRIVTHAQASAMDPAPSAEEEADSLEEEAVGECNDDDQHSGDRGELFESKMETTISAVWVEFDDDKQHIIAAAEPMMTMTAP